MLTLNKNCSFEEHSNYVDTYIATWDSVNDTVMHITIWLENSNHTNSGERLEKAREKRLLLAQRDLLEAKRQAFRANKSPINPPTSEQVKKAKKLADDIDEIIRTSQATDAALSLVEQSLKLYNEIQEV